MSTVVQHPRLVSRPVRPAPLWREVLGARLRALRRDRGEILTTLAARAGVSPQYLSEIERGRKEPSSEMIEAVAGALDVPLVELVSLVAADLQAGAVRSTAHRPAGPAALALAA